jgi:hypothetical protein
MEFLLHIFELFHRILETIYCEFFALQQVFLYDFLKLSQNLSNVSVFNKNNFLPYLTKAD